MISVVIPTFRRPDLLARLLDSICIQTTLPDEVIVIDDASGMDEIYQQCIRQFQDRLPSLTYYKLEQNSGAPHARNIGILRAQHDWIALVDDDDEWLPEKLARQRHLAEKCPPSVGLIYTWTHAQGSVEQPSYQSSHSIQGDARRAILSSNFIMSPSVMVKSQAIKAAGLFDKSLPSCQDWDMWTRIFLNGYTCAVVPEILSIYHRHGGESIGLSKTAQLGYKVFLEKHFLAILRYTGPINILKKIWLYVQVRRAIRAQA